MYQSIYLSIYLTIHLSIYLFYLCINLTIHLFYLCIYLTIHLFYLSIQLSICSIYVYIYLSIFVLGCISASMVYLRKKQLDHIVYKRIQKQIANGAQQQTEAVSGVLGEAESFNTREHRKYCSIKYIFQTQIWFDECN